MLKLKLSDAKQREEKQKLMYEQVMTAFQTGGPATVDVDAERKKITEELVAAAITRNHPKVKDIVAEASSSLLEKMHLQREQGLKEVFKVEKKAQELSFRLQNKDRELESAQNEL